MASEPRSWEAKRVQGEADDIQLLRAAKAGDAAALETLLARHQGRVLRFGRKMCRNPEDAEDVLQETLLALAGGIGGFREEASLSTWLYTVARRLCAKKRRRSKFAPPIEHSLDEAVVPELARLADPATPADVIVATRELEAVVDQAISTLGATDREVLVLRDVEGLSAKEVSEVVGVSVEAVKSRLHRARLVLRSKLDPELAIEPKEGGCPDVLGLYSRNLEDQLSPSVCAAMEQHLLGCPRCQRACNSLKRSLALCRASPAIEVPEALQRSIRAAVQQLRAPTRGTKG